MHSLSTTKFVLHLVELGWEHSVLFGIQKVLYVPGYILPSVALHEGRHWFDTVCERICLEEWPAFNVGQNFGT